jgi:hypothetical protein
VGERFLAETIIEVSGLQLMTFDQSTSGTGIESLYQVAVSFMRDLSFILPLAGVRAPKLICMFQITLLTRGGGISL